MATRGHLLGAAVRVLEEKYSEAIVQETIQDEMLGEKTAVRSLHGFQE